MTLARKRCSFRPEAEAVAPPEKFHPSSGWTFFRLLPISKIKSTKTLDPCCIHLHSVTSRASPSHIQWCSNTHTDTHICLLSQTLIHTHTTRHTHTYHSTAHTHALHTVTDTHTNTHITHQTYTHAYTHTLCHRHSTHTHTPLDTNTYSPSYTQPRSFNESELCQSL